MEQHPNCVLFSAFVRRTVFFCLSTFYPSFINKQGSCTPFSGLIQHAAPFFLRGYFVLCSPRLSNLLDGVPLPECLHEELWTYAKQYA